MEQQNKHRMIVSERATQMLVSHVAFLAQTSKFLRADAAEMPVAHRGIYSQKCLPFYSV